MSQYSKNLYLINEYKKLSECSPFGFFLLPEEKSLNSFHGVIFLRSGIYQGGIFRFFLYYPDDIEGSSSTSFPLVYFLPSICHPLIDKESGALNVNIMYKFLRASLQIPSSATPSTPSSFSLPLSDSILVTVATYIKAIFNTKKFEILSDDDILNHEAWNLYKNNKSEFIIECEKEVKNSIEKIFSPPTIPSSIPISSTLTITPGACPLIFSPSLPAHTDFIKSYFHLSLKRKQEEEEAENEDKDDDENEENNKNSSSSSTFLHTNTKSRSVFGDDSELNNNNNNDNDNSLREMIDSINLNKDEGKDKLQELEKDREIYNSNDPDIINEVFNDLYNNENLLAPN